MANVFITGGGGFLADHLARALLKDGHRVSLLSRQRRPRGMLAGARAVRGDLLLSKRPIVPASTDIVFHLAARASVTESFADPPGTVEVNAMGTARLLEEIRTRGIGVERFVLPSTALVYGPPFRRAIAEDHPVRPRNPYAASKMAAECCALAYDSLYDVPVSVLRLFNVYGPGQRPQYVIPTVLSQCLWSRELKIGNPWPFRDFVYVDDAVRLFRAAASRRRARGEILNVASGKGTRIDAMVRVALRVTGANLKPRSEAARRRRGDFDRLVGDIGKARRLVGWSPKVSLEDGLARTASFLRTQGPPRP